MILSCHIIRSFFDDFWHICFLSKSHWHDIYLIEINLASIEKLTNPDFFEMDQIEATIVLMKEDIVATIRDLKQIIIGSRFKSFSKFKKYYKAQDKFCHCTVSWLTPRLCIECHDCETVKNSVMCIDCFIAGNHLNHNYSIKTLPFGSCHCGRSFLFKNNSCFCPHHQISTDQTKHEIPEENIIRSILEVLIKQLPKVGTVYNSEKVIKFILSIARISDSFLEIVADCFIHQMKVIFKIFNKSPIFRPLFNEKFIKLVNCLSVNHAFAISSILFFLHFSQYLVIDQFLCMSGEKKNKNYRHISGLLNFPEPYLLLILFKGYDWTSFSISFIDNFQDILNDIQFIHKPKYFPFFYKNIFKAIRIFLLNDVENNVQDIFDNLLEIIARTQLRIKIKYDESNLLIHKVPYYLHWTGSILKLLDNQEINLDELFELVDCLFQNSFSDNEFDEIINENQNENQNQNNEEIETKGNDNLYEANEESSEYKKYFRSILDKGVNITVFNQILHIFFILITRVTPIISLNNQLSENVIIYGSIISSRFFSLYLSAKLGSITGDDDTFCSLANKIGNKAHLSLIRSNFGFLQIASLLSDNKEQIMRLIAESLGIFTCKDCDQSTMKLCFIFIIGCLYFDRTSSLNYSKKEIKKLQAIHKLKKAPLHLKNLTRKEIDEIKDVSIRLKL
ncbi:hypothetical protein TRFO_05146 [Tritrichomonas foetus]|uniref:UBR-type domain-containing protein n=1 Tax=Tritrichomonas foetus TaxID=1144522 RepID=A0A1J4KCZ9_9EUKA|nr:hypothetical protein TRFO_05146 [Tritrichomonas foetus]|eukprot:OHT07526.1 hypothetical protein TRFO_05146 [Tritrichomonas foetus]